MWASRFCACSMCSVLELLATGLEIQGSPYLVRRSMMDFSLYSSTNFCRSWYVASSAVAVSWVYRATTRPIIPIPGLAPRYSSPVLTRLSYSVGYPELRVDTLPLPRLVVYKCARIAKVGYAFQRRLRLRHDQLCSRRNKNRVRKSVSWLRAKIEVVVACISCSCRTLTSVTLTA
jgi:hypothetical protein